MQFQDEWEPVRSPSLKQTSCLLHIAAGHRPVRLGLQLAKQLGHLFQKQRALVFPYGGAATRLTREWSPAS